MDNPLTPDVSVIIASYNVESYIEKAVCSALKQEGVRVEVILVDDASTDSTVEIVSRLKDPRVRIFLQHQNAGPGATRNVGLAAASAPWVAILDGDDTFKPGRLSRCLARATKENADIVVDNIEILRESNGTRSPMFALGEFGRKPLLDIATFINGNLKFFNGHSLGHLKPVLSNAFLQKHRLRYDPEVRIGEDYLLMVEALACGARCAVEPTMGYTYTVRPGSYSHRLTLIDIERMQKGDRRFLERYKLNAGALRVQKKREFGLKEAYYFTKLVDALKNREMQTALRIVAQRPTSILHFWTPAKSRIVRLLRNKNKSASFYPPKIVNPP